jgi:hypothetical protein
VIRLNHTSESIDNIDFRLIRLSDRQTIHSYRRIDDLHDGSYLFRYRLYESIENLHISIRFANETIEHTIHGYAYSDGCYCPERNRTQWLESLDCSSMGSLRTNLRAFNQIDMKHVLNKANEKFFRHKYTYALCHYVIKDNRVSTIDNI